MTSADRVNNLRCCQVSNKFALLATLLLFEEGLISAWKENKDILMDVIQCFERNLITAN